MTEPETNPVSQAYARATRINAKLASRFDANLATEGKQAAQTLLDHVRSEVEDFDEFVARVDRSELFSLHDSAQIDKKQKHLKVLYVRAADLLETIAEAEARSAKRR
jgi:hypothetical protein